jgi:hypothetical protein
MMRGLVAAGLFAVLVGLAVGDAVGRQLIPSVEWQWDGEPVVTKTGMKIGDLDEYQVEIKGKLIFADDKGLVKSPSDYKIYVATPPDLTKFPVNPTYEVAVTVGAKTQLAAGSLRHYYPITAKSSPYVKDQRLKIVPVLTYQLAAGAPKQTNSFAPEKYVDIK